MFRTMLSAKIHLAVVTKSELHYIGSITIDQDILDAVGIIENEKLQIVNITNGNRWETYALPGKRGGRDIELNGGGARLVHPGDEVIIMAYKVMTEDEAQLCRPKVALMNKDNTIRELLHGEEPYTEYRH